MASASSFPCNHVPTTLFPRVRTFAIIVAPKLQLFHCKNNHLTYDRPQSSQHYHQYFSVKEAFKNDLQKTYGIFHITYVCFMTPLPPTHQT